MTGRGRGRPRIPDDQKAKRVVVLLTPDDISYLRFWAERFPDIDIRRRKERKIPVNATRVIRVIIADHKQLFGKEFSTYKNKNVRL